jgi:putative SOS response-associated peptidase YedK
VCGRFTNKLTWAEIHALYQITTPPLNFEARYNIAPTQRVPVVRRTEDGGRSLGLLHWGLVPFWAKDRTIAFKTINARAETIATTPAFRAAFRQRRCLVPASGFYEWVTEGKQKQPLYITHADGSPLTFAGLWERWDKDGEPLESFTIVTTQANATCSPIHDRMPVILGRADFAAWLDPQTGADAAQDLLRPCADDALTMWKVDAKVNRSAKGAVDDASCIEPLAQNSLL